MFKDLLARLAHPEPPRTPLPPADAQHALGALLVRVAKADRAYLFQEIEQIDRLLAEIFGLNPLEAAKMRAACERLEEEMPETAKLGRIIQEGVEPAEVTRVVRGLWSVMEADGQRHESELDIVARATEALGMSPEEAAALRSS